MGMGKHIPRPGRNDNLREMQHRESGWRALLRRVRRGLMAGGKSQRAVSEWGAVQAE